MIPVLHNFGLKAYNTFGIDVKASAFISIHSIDQLNEVLETYDASEVFMVGGGSNMLLTQDIDKTVLHINLKGIEIIEENDDTVTLEVMGGENWHDMVQHTINHNYGGLENLSLIPGNTGTSPIQNIGAYGVELKDHFISCNTIEISSGCERMFTLDECKFGYRDSVFKNELKDQYVITSVRFCLRKKNHQLKTSYGAIQEELERMGCINPTIRNVADAVIAIRQSKLPDPKQLGNSGSFFKNPIITIEQYKTYLENFPNMPSYSVNDIVVKVPAGWLIDQCGLKGKRWGDAGVHSKQALVLVNYGNATGQEIIKTAQRVQTAVMEKFGIEIVPEVNVF